MSAEELVLGFFVMVLAFSVGVLAGVQLAKVRLKRLLGGFADGDFEATSYEAYQTVARRSTILWGILQGFIGK